MKSHSLLWFSRLVVFNFFLGIILLIVGLLLLAPSVPGEPALAFSYQRTFQTLPTLAVVVQFDFHRG